MVSIIIVNYNVRFFLEQCLHSVCAAGQNVPVQVIVVDNASTDGSVAYLQPLFPQVTFIQSNSNLGFAKACNLGLQQATGAYILFLNPDTLLAEDTRDDVRGEAVVRRVLRPRRQAGVARARHPGGRRRDDRGEDPPRLGRR